MKSSRNIARQLFGLTLTLVGLLSWHILPIAHPELAVRAATRARVTEPTGQAVSRAAANGRIAFVSAPPYPTDIYTMNPDGSDRKQLTFSQEYETGPVWSPDGTKIAFARFCCSFSSDSSEIFVMNPDGSDQRRLTQSRFDSSPTWSPDGTKIAFVRGGPGIFVGIVVMNADGSDQRAVASTSGLGEPAWSPDGLKLAVTANGIYLINVDGSNLTQITQPPDLLSVDYAPAWSPDGSKITFNRCVDSTGFGCDTSHLWGVNADGSNPTQLMDTQAGRHAWSPDGTKMIFDNGGDLLMINPDGSGLTNITNTSGKYEWSPSWQPLVSAACPNPIDCAEFFVRQHYRDFLGREPDPPGFAAWQAVLNNCLPGDTSCDRIHVSSAFFQSPEFQQRGYFVYRFYSVAFGRKPDYDEFTPDLAKVSGFLSDAELEAAKVAFIAEFMNRPAFLSKFNGLSNTEYVETLLSTADISHSNRDTWIAALTNGSRTRAQVLREIAESTEVYNKYYNQAFVVMQYFGYLHRQPDALYLDWIAHLDATGDSRNMINGFMNSLEYRARFGP